MSCYNGGRVIRLSWPVQWTRVSTNYWKNELRVSGTHHCRDANCGIRAAKVPLWLENVETRGGCACVGREDIRQVSEPSAQFSCENETSLENMLLKRKREKNHQVILTSARFR